MDGCSIFLLVFVLGLVAVIPFAMDAKQKHDQRLASLREKYRAAKGSGVLSEFKAAARAMFAEVRTGNPSGLPATADEIYRDALRLLKANDDARAFALEFGRLSYGLKRKDRNPTVYDEQAIQNDIQAHT